MVVTDYFTKWVEAIPLPDQTAKTTAEALFKHVISRYGPPEAIVSDRGRNFTSKIFSALCELFKIDQRLTTAYNPASNGETERFNRTMTTMLRKELKDGHHEDWEQLLDCVLYAYRTSVHSSTKETPFYLMHGRDQNNVLDLLLHATPITDNAPEYLEQLHQRLAYSFKRARDENEKAREQQKLQYDKRAKQLLYKVGDKVLLDIKVVKEGDSRKFTSKYKGPYRISKVYENKTVDIVDGSQIPQRVHMNRLRPLFETMLWKDEPSPLTELPYAETDAQELPRDLAGEAPASVEEGRATDNPATCVDEEERLSCNADMPDIPEIIPTTVQENIVDIQHNALNERPRRIRKPVDKLNL